MSNKYLNSENHFQNLALAREQAMSTFMQCQFCNNNINKSGFKNHQLNCYLNPTNLRLCEICNKPIKNWKSSQTCGRSCANTKFRSGPNHANWKNDRYKTTCFHYHEKKCIICSEDKIVEVHHLDENHNNNIPENLIPLCPTHHQYWHSNFKHLIESKVLQYQADFIKNKIK